MGPWPGLGCRARMAEGLGTTTKGMAASLQEGWHMNSIVSIVGAVVIIGFVLKLLGAY
jgi:hypothetical protein